MRFLSACVLATLLLAAGCGYHVSGLGSNLPNDVHALSIPRFKNATTRPLLEDIVSNDVLLHFARVPGLEVVNSGADAVLEGMVSSYSSRPVSYGANDEITEYRSTIGIRATLKRLDNGRILWKGDLSWSEEYPTSLDKTAQGDREDEAIRLASERLASELLDRVLAGF